MASAIQQKNTSSGVHPLKFALWLIIISIIMMFAAFTSAYIVRKEEGNWLEYALPDNLVLNTIFIVLSSVTMQWAFNTARKDNLRQLKLALLLTMILGISFLVGQWDAWVDLVGRKIFFGGADANPSGSFLYVLMGVHGFHLVTGLIFILIVLISSLKFKVHSRNLLRIELCSVYWHFLTGLWLYLYLFLTLNH
jgi:cytochrome c oxidase subunit III